jgi:hypothetical protein
MSAKILETKVEPASKNADDFIVILAFARASVFFSLPIIYLLILPSKA